MKMVGQQTICVCCGNQLYVMCITLKKEAVIFGGAENSLAVITAVVDVVEVSRVEVGWVCHI